MKALIVDDSRAMRMFLGNIVKEMGFKVVEAADGREALAHLKQEMPIDVALIDIDMPNMNGIELLSEVVKEPRYRTVKMMMVSSHTTMEAVEESLTRGAHDYLMKPLTKEMLRDKFRVLGLY